MKDVSCSIITDLLPLYAENMAGEASRQAVAAHVAGCPACRAKLEEMTRTLPVSYDSNRATARPLKRFRFHVLLNILGIPLWLPLLMTLCAVLLTLYACLWVAGLVLWTVPLSLGSVAVAGIVGAVAAFAQAAFATGGLCVAVAAVGAGLAVLSGLLCGRLSHWLVRLSAALWSPLRKRFSGRKEN